MAGGGRIKGITIEIGGNTTKLESALKGVNSTISQTQTKLKDVDKLLKLDPTNTDLLKQKQGYLKDAIQATKDKLDQEKTALEQLKNADSSGETIQQQQDLEREIAATEQALQNLEDEYKDFGSVAKQQIKAAADKMGEVGDKITGIGTTLSTHVSAPITAVGAGAVAAFNEVDGALDTMIAKTGATGDEAESLGGIMENIATTIPTDFDTAAQAVGEVSTRFNLTGDALEDLSTQFVQFAKLNNTDVSTSVDTVQNALSSFNMGAGDAGTVLDVLNRTAQNTGAKVDTMAASLVNNSTALQQMGMDIYQSVDFLGQLETAGADSEAVISGMKRALKEATDAGVPFDQALADLEDTITNGTDDMDGLSAAYDMFGKSGASVYTAVKNGQISFKDLADSQDILADSTGNVKDTYDETVDPIDSMTTAMNSLKLAGSDLGSTIGEVLAPIIEGLSTKIQALRDWFSGLSSGQQDLIVKIGMVVAVIGPLLVVLGTVISSISAIAGAMTILMGPVGIVIAIIAALVAVGVLLYQNWDTIKEKAGELKDMIAEKFDAVKEKFNEVKDKVIEIKDAFVEKFDAIKDKVSGAFNAVKDTIGNVMGAAKDTIQEKLNNIKTAYEENGGGVKGIVSAGMEAVKGYYTSGYTFIDNLTGGKLSAIKDTISNKMSDAKQAVQDKLDSVKTAFSDKLTSSLDTARDKFESIKTAVSDKLSSAKTAVTDKLSSIKTAFTDKLGGALDTVRNKFDSIKNAIRDKLTSAKNTVSNIIDRIKGLFNFQWSLPKLKLPHFSWSWQDVGGVISLPSISVSWYKKAMDNAYMLNGASIFGTMGGKLLGGGEAGSEMIIGKETLLSMISEAVGRAGNTDINVVVNPSPGMDERQLADMVAARIAAQVSRRRAVFS